MAAATEIRMRKLDRMEITLTVTRELRLRMWLGLKLMVLGARITGASVVVERKERAP